MGGGKGATIALAILVIVAAIAGFFTGPQVMPKYVTETVTTEKTVTNTVTSTVVSTTTETETATLTVTKTETKTAVVTKTETVTAVSTETVPAWLYVGTVANFEPFTLPPRSYTVDSVFADSGETIKVYIASSQPVYAAVISIYDYPDWLVFGNITALDEKYASTITLKVTVPEQGYYVIYLENPNDMEVTISTYRIEIEA